MNHYRMYPSSTEKDVKPIDKLNGIGAGVGVELPPPPPPHELMINNIDIKYNFFIVLIVSSAQKKRGLKALFL